MRRLQRWRWSRLFAAVGALLRRFHGYERDRENGRRAAAMIFWYEQKGHEKSNCRSGRQLLLFWEVVLSGERKSTRLPVPLRLNKILSISCEKSLVKKLTSCQVVSAPAGCSQYWSERLNPNTFSASSWGVQCCMLPRCLLCCRKQCQCSASAQEYLCALSIYGWHFPTSLNKFNDYIFCATCIEQ